MRVGRFLTLAAVALTASACYHQVVQTGRTPGPTVIDKPFAMSFIWGLVPPADIDVSAQCRTGIATVVTEMSLVNGLVHFVTFGLVTPRHVTITCASGSSSRPGTTEFYVDRNATPQERAVVFVKAAEESERTQLPVVVRF